MRTQYGPQTRLGTPVFILAIPPAQQEQRLAPSSQAPGRVYFAEPGKSVIVRYGDFQPMLKPQMAHPERLRESHRLACFLQVYEALVRQPSAMLAAARFLPLTTETEAKLALPPAKTEAPAVEPRSELVLPNQRFFRLRMKSDPTRDPITGPCTRRQNERLPMRRSIPERYLNAWGFRFSREEVLYDMNQCGVLARLAEILRRWLARGEFRKWRAMLAGKPVDDQLFAVRPPAGGLACEKVREWASRTLGTAGYEPGVMLVEWEIFWRRKGL